METTVHPSCVKTYLCLDSFTMNGWSVDHHSLHRVEAVWKKHLFLRFSLLQRLGEKSCVCPCFVQSIRFRVSFLRCDVVFLMYGLQDFLLLEVISPLARALSHCLPAKTNPLAWKFYTHVWFLFVSFTYYWIYHLQKDSPFPFCSEASFTYRLFNLHIRLYSDYVLEKLLSNSYSKKFKVILRLE